jgi:carbonic anhydrase
MNPTVSTTTRCHLDAIGRVPHARRAALVATLKGLCLALALTAAQAEPASSSRAAPTKAETQVAPGATPDSQRTHAVKGAPRPDASSAPVPQIDPLEHLRGRLAERLGRRVTTPEGAPREVKLMTHMPAPRGARAVGKVHQRSSSAPAQGMGPHAPHWSYEGATGAQAWAQLKPEFALCGRGQRQSPIDIRDGIALQLEEVRFDYRASSVRVTDTGHTVQADVDGGNTMTVMGRRYELVQFHFHRPSEERIDGRQFEMSAHLVHRDAEGALAVVAVLLEPGPAHPVVQAVWSALPLERGGVLAASAPINPADLLPTDRRYYTYMGSLTTPPCTEDVVWVVMQQPVAVSPAQVGVFTRLYPMNARPVQPVAGRRIKQSE